MTDTAIDIRGLTKSFGPTRVLEDMTLSVSRGMMSRASLAGLWISAHLLVWTVAFGMRQPTEARVGMVGLGVCVGWVVYLILAESLRGF